MMNEISYSGYRFTTEIIQQAIWLYVRFTLSFRGRCHVWTAPADQGLFLAFAWVVGAVMSSAC